MNEATNGANQTDGLATAHRVAFYVSAHQDDWQLFMTPSAFHDMLDGDTRCVFMHMTAGDAGLGMGGGGRKHPLYLAREYGAEAAIRFMADSDGRPPVEPATSTVTINGHPVRCVRYRNTAAYFLRLPDGSPTGTGYADTGHQSLKRLAAAEIATLTAIDSTAAYRGWDDLVATVRGIIEAERGDAASVDLHVPDPDPAINPDDHSDHYLTAKAALDGAQGLPGVRRLYHRGYASMNLPENLDGEDRDMKCAVYAVTLAAVQAFDHQTSWRHYDQMFIGRDYYRLGETS